MLEVETPADMDERVGQVLGTSDWLEISQARIDTFAEATGDHQWIHVDAERAAREMPGGKTIAHGFLTLSLVPVLSRSVLHIRKRSRAVNYGSNKVRFTNPVSVDARIRLRVTLKASEPVEGGRRLFYENIVEIDGDSRPALIAETISVVYD